MARSYLLPYHSFADVITNSSSELFMLMPLRDRGEVTKIIAMMLGVEEHDVKFTLLDNYDDVVEFLCSRDHHAVPSLFHKIFVGKGFDLDHEVKDVEHRSGEPWHAFSDRLIAEESAFETALRQYLTTKKGELLPYLTPLMHVYCWCDEDADTDAVIGALGGVWAR